MILSIFADCPHFPTTTTQGVLASLLLSFTELTLLPSRSDHQLVRGLKVSFRALAASLASFFFSCIYIVYTYSSRYHMKYITRNKLDMQKIRAKTKTDVCVDECDIQKYAHIQYKLIDVYSIHTSDSSVRSTSSLAMFANL